MEERLEAIKEHISKNLGDVCASLCWEKGRGSNNLTNLWR